MNRKQRRAAEKQSHVPGPRGAPGSAIPTRAQLRVVLADALDHHRAGRSAEAEARYRWVLRHEPGNTEALHGLGTLAHDLGHDAAALDLIAQAIERDGGRAGFHASLGIVLLAADRLDEAEAAFQRSIALVPDQASTHFNLGLVFWKQGRLDEAASAYRAALRLDPKDAETLSELGNVESALGRLEQAITCYRAALAVRPGYAIAHYNLGLTYRAQGEIDAAEASYRKAIELDPGYVAAHYNLGNLLFERGRLDDAVSSFRSVCALAPTHAGALNNLGVVLEEQGQLAAAGEAFRQALSVRSDFAEPRYNLAGVLLEQGRITEAVAAYDAALSVKPDYIDAAMGVAFAHLYRPGVRLAEVLACARAIDAAFAARFRDRWPAHPRPETRDGRPKIGFVSADFRSHAVGALVLPAIEGLARAGHTVTCYSNTLRRDAMTERFAAASAFQPVAGLSDDALFELIRADGIDILVDLSGYTDGNRLLVFARKPAPIQVSWLGYPATTGMASIDYIIADGLQLPPNAGQFYSESVVRLPDCYVAFAPPEEAPEIGPLPAGSHGAITFGSFNAAKKITPEVVATWSEILRRLPTSRLLLKAPAFDCLPSREHYLAQFAAEGITDSRLSFHGRSARTAHLRQMLEVDIALDTFPYSGGQTTLEALWMGLPVVAFPGETFASRHALAYLETIGLGRLATSSAEAYIALAVDLDEDRTALAAMRSNMRTRMLASPLGDKDRFVTVLAAAFATMWERWCDGAPTTSIDI